MSLEGVKHAFAKGDRQLAGMAAFFGGALLLNVIGNAAGLALGVEHLDWDLSTSPRDFLGTVVEAPLKEEAIFRLAPLLVAAAFRNNPAVLGPALIFSTFGFAGYHYWDDNGDFVLSRIGEKELFHAAGGAAFTGIALARGTSHSLAAHSGYNLGYWLSIYLARAV